MSDTINTTNDNVVTNSETTSSETNTGTTPITTNLVTGKLADGSENININMQPSTASIFNWNSNATDIRRVSGDINDATKYIPASNATILPASRDGSQIYFISDGYYLDLSDFITRKHLNPDNVVTKDMLDGNLVTREQFLEALQYYIKIESYTAKFGDYYDKIETDLLLKPIKDLLNKIPNELYSKKEIQVLLDNIDKYSRRDIDLKLSKIESKIIANNNDWYKSIHELATIEQVRELINGFITNTELNQLKEALELKISEIKSNLSSVFTKDEMNSTLSNYPTNTELNNTISNLVTTTALSDAVSNLVNNSDLSTRLSVLITNDRLLEALRDYTNTSDLNDLLADKADSSEITTLDQKIDTEIANVRRSVVNGVTEGTLENVLENYVKSIDLNRELVSIRDLFNNYDNIIKSNEKLDNLKNEINNTINGLVNKSDYQQDKATFVTTTALTLSTDEIKGMLVDKATTGYVDDEIAKLKAELRLSIAAGISEEETARRLAELVTQINEKPTRVELEAKSSLLQTNIDDLKTYADQTFETKSNVTNALLNKVDSTAMQQAVDEAKVDLENKINAVKNSSITENDVNDKLVDYATKSHVTSLLSNKLERTDLDDAKDELNTKIDNTKDNITGQINLISTDVSQLRIDLTKSINDAKTELESADLNINTSLNRLQSSISGLESITEVDRKIQDTSDVLDGKITALDQKLTNKDNELSLEISNIKVTLSDKITQSVVTQLESDLTGVINNKETALEQKITEVNNKFDDYVTTEQLGVEKNKLATQQSLSTLEGVVNSNKTELEGLINTNKSNITNLENNKLDKTTYENYIKNVFTKSEVLARVITYDNVFKKSEVTALVDAVRTIASGNTDAISQLRLDLNARYTNKQIDDKITETSTAINRNIAGISTNLDNKVDKLTYNTELSRVNTTLNDKPSYAELRSAIETNNKKYTTSTEIGATLDSFKTEFWDDLTQNGFISPEDFNDRMSAVVSLEKLNAELSKYASIEALNAKILEVNGLSRLDVQLMLESSNNTITNAYQQYISNLLSTYVTVNALRDALDEKVSVADYTRRMNEISTTYVDKTTYENDKFNFVTSATINSVIDNKLLTSLGNYYTKQEMDDIVSGLRNVILSNTNLFYSKEIMDDKLKDLETKENAITNKTLLNDSIDSLKLKFADYPTTLEMESRISSVLAGNAGVAMDSFYNKATMDRMLLQKADLDAFNAFKSKVYEKDALDTKFGDYTLSSDFTRDINSVRGDISTINSNPILSVNPTDLVTNTQLASSLGNYTSTTGLPAIVDPLIDAKLIPYINSSTLESRLNTFKSELGALEGLTNYVTKNEFNLLKNNIYEKSHIDGIDAKFVDYTTTVNLNQQLSTLDSKIKSESDINGLISTALSGYTNTLTLTSLLADKTSQSDLNDALDSKDTEYNNKFALKSTLLEYSKTTELDSKFNDYLHKTTGGIVAGATEFSAPLTATGGVKTGSIDLMSGNIINGGSITANSATLTTGNINTITSTDSTVDNNLVAKYITVKNDGRLALPMTKLEPTQTFTDSPASVYGEVNNTVRIIHKDGTEEIVLNIGITNNDTVNAKMLKFNDDGSISTRKVIGPDFSGDWIPLALKSDLDGLRREITSGTVTSGDVTEKLKEYVQKTELASTLEGYYNKIASDAKFDDINDKLDDRYTKAETNLELAKKADISAISTLTNDLNTYKADRYTNAELTSIFKPLVLQDVDTKLADYVTTSALNVTLGGYVTTANLPGLLQTNNTDLTRSLESTFVAKTALTGALQDYYKKTDLDPTLATFITNSTLTSKLVDYTNTVDMNSAISAVRTTANDANRAATDAKTGLDDYKLEVARDYITKATLPGEITSAVSSQLTGYATTSYVNQAKSDLNDTISGNKTAIEQTVSNLDTRLTLKDQELENAITTNTAKFVDYITTTKHTESVNTERGVSDSKYATKAELSALGTTSNFVTNEKLADEISKVPTTIYGDSRYTTLKNTVDGIEPRLSSVETTVQNLQAGSVEPVGYQDLKTQVGTNKDNITSLTQSVSSNTSDISTMQTEVAKIAGIESSIASLSTIPATIADYNEVKGKVTTLEGSAVKKTELSALILPDTAVTMDATKANRILGLSATSDVTLDLTALTTGDVVSVINIGTSKTITFTGKTIVGDSTLTGNKGSTASILIYEGEAYISTSAKYYDYDY